MPCGPSTDINIFYYSFQLSKRRTRVGDCTEEWVWATRDMLACSRDDDDCSGTSSGVS
jgi:hypothetical protein